MLALLSPTNIAIALVTALIGAVTLQSYRLSMAQAENAKLRIELTTARQRAANMELRRNEEDRVSNSPDPLDELRREYQRTD